MKFVRSAISSMSLLLFWSIVSLTGSARAADINVAAPANGAVVRSPFVLQATSTSCLSSPTASMAYSLDHGTDTVFNPATSINTNVTAAHGTHTLKVKAWGNQTFCEKDIAITVGDDIAVTSPINGSTVPSTFLLNASAPTCGGSNTASMTYSFDSQPDNPPVNATSLNQNVSTTNGSHLLRVKAWGSGTFCETDLSINVSAQSVVISSPANNATVPLTFQLQAQAPTCNGRSTNTMAYNFAGHPDTTLPGAQSIDTQVTAPTTGVQQLNVKAWNGAGDLCETSVSVDAEQTAADITISQPTNPNVAQSFHLQASSTTCQGITTSSMKYSFDSLADNPTAFGQSIDTTATAPGSGAHLLRVKAWNTSGGFCEQDMNLNVINDGISWPPTAHSFLNIEQDVPDYTGAYKPGTTSDHIACDDGATNPPNRSWMTQRDCGTDGSKTGMTTTLSQGPGAPPTNTTVREYQVTTASADSSGKTPGMRWSDRLVGSPQSDTNFGFDLWVYFATDGSLDRTASLELDINQVAATKTYIMSHQCNFKTGHWQVGGWTTTDQLCSRSQFAAGSWHHVQIQAHRSTSPDQIVFQQVAVDGQVQQLTCGGGSCTRGPLSLGWMPDGLILPNFQMDAVIVPGTQFTGITAYVDSFSMYSWPD